MVGLQHPLLLSENEKHIKVYVDKGGGAAQLELMMITILRIGIQLIEPFKRLAELITKGCLYIGYLM